MRWKRLDHMFNTVLASAKMMNQSELVQITRRIMMTSIPVKVRGGIARGVCSSYETALDLNRMLDMSMPARRDSWRVHTPQGGSALI